MLIKRYALFLFSSLLTACISDPLPPADIYTISPLWTNNATKQNIPSELIIKLAPLRATRELTGTQIFYKDREYGQNSYVYSRWNDSPVRLLMTFFHVSIEESQLFKAMVPATSSSKSDLLLESTLLEFSHHIKPDGTSDGVIRIRFYLIDNISKRVISTREFISRVPALTVNAQGAVEALNKAAVNIAGRLIDWLAELEDY